MQFNNDGNSAVWFRVLGRLNNTPLHRASISDIKELMADAADVIEQLILERSNLSQMASYWKGMAKGIESVKTAQPEDMEMSR